MCSKLTALGVFALSTLMLLTGCDQFLRSRSSDEVRESQKVTISTNEVKCLEDTAKNLEAFIADKGDPEVLDRTIGCVQKSLKTFTRLTRGSQPNAYLAKEVQYFFNTFLLKQNQISDSFLAEIMKIKVVAVGGTTEVVTNLELEQFSEFLGKLQAQLKTLQGSMRFTIFRANVSGSRSETVTQNVADVRSKLSNLSDFILKNTRLTSSRYQWVDFVSFLHELHGFIGESQDLDELFKWLPFAESVKLLFLGKDAKLVSESGWHAAADWSVNTYATALSFFYQIKDNPFTTPAQWNVLVSWLDDSIQAIESSPAMRDSKILEAKALDQVIDEVYKLNLFQTVLSPEMTKSVYRSALIHFIELPSGRGDPLSIQGLTEAHLRILKQEYNVWKLSQKFLNETYAQHADLKLVNLRWYAPRFDIQRILADTPMLEREELERSWQDFQNLILSQPGVTYDAKSKLRIAHGTESLSYPFTGANMMNGLRSFTRFVLRGYGDRRARFVFDNKIYRPRLINMEEDFRDFGRAIGLLDPRENNAASKTFDQGNFFTFHGDGDEVLTATETFEIFNMMVSGARSQLLELYQDLEKQKCLVADKDIFGKPFVIERCFFDFVKQTPMTYMDNLQGMRDYLGSLNNQQWAQKYHELLSLALAKNHRQGYLESSEIRSINTIYHFIETLMVVYDTNQNQHLSEAEIVRALPRFGPFIQKMIAKKPGWIDRNVGPYFLEDILLFLVYEGHEPTGLELTAFKAKRTMGMLEETDRGNIITLLSVLNNLLNDPANATR